MIRRNLLYCIVFHSLDMVFSISVYFYMNDEFLNVNASILSQKFHGSFCASEMTTFLNVFLHNIYYIYSYIFGIASKLFLSPIEHVSKLIVGLSKKARFSVQNMSYLIFL